MESNINIRKIMKDDITSIFQMELDAFKPMHYPLFVLRQFYDTLPGLFFVAVNDVNQIKGYCIGGIDYESRTGWIFALAVAKPEQKKRIAQRITTKLLTAFQNKNINTIQLTTSPDNNAAINLYEKLGFKKVKEDMNYYFDNSPRILMKLVMK